MTYRRCEAICVAEDNRDARCREQAVREVGGHAVCWVHGKAAELRARGKAVLFFGNVVPLVVKADD